VKQSSLFLPYQRLVQRWLLLQCSLIYEGERIQLNGLRILRCHLVFSGNDDECSNAKDDDVDTTVDNAVSAT
jgi:hypothetical protein